MYGDVSRRGDLKKCGAATSTMLRDRVRHLLLRWRSLCWGASMFVRGATTRWRCCSDYVMLSLVSSVHVVLGVLTFRLFVRFADLVVVVPCCWAVDSRSLRGGVVCLCCFCVRYVRSFDSNIFCSPIFSSPIGAQQSPLAGLRWSCQFRLVDF